MCFYISPPGGKRRSWIEILRVLCTLVDEELDPLNGLGGDVI
jgi:hypothetical protein